MSVLCTAVCSGSVTATLVSGTTYRISGVFSGTYGLGGNTLFM